MTAGFIARELRRSCKGRGLDTLSTMFPTIEGIVGAD